MSSASSTHPVGLGDLVEDLGLLAALGRVFQGDLDAAHGVANVDEGARLAAGAVNGERMSDRRLHQEAVQHGAVVAVVVKAVDQALVENRLGRLGTPDNSLVQVGDANLVVRRVESEEKLIERFSHVIHRAGIGRVQDLAVDLAVGRGDLHREIALGDGRRTRPAVAVDAHGAEVNHRDVETGGRDRDQNVVRGAHVVIDGVALGGGVAHGIGRGALFTKVHDGVGTLVAEQVFQAVVLLGEVKVNEAESRCPSVPSTPSCARQWGRSA